MGMCMSAGTDMDFAIRLGRDSMLGREPRQNTKRGKRGLRSAKRRVQQKDAGGGENAPPSPHRAERALLDAVGLFREGGPSKKVTVEALLADREFVQRARAHVRNKPPTKQPSLDQDKGTPTSSFAPPPTTSFLGTPVDTLDLAATQSHTQRDDFSLLSTVTTRLTAVERVAMRQADQLAEQNETIRELRIKLKAFEEAASTAPPTGTLTSAPDTFTPTLATASSFSSDYFQLSLDNARLKKQVHDMETFLADYGLLWVGSNGPPEPAKAPMDIYFPIPALRDAIADLNGMVTRGPTVVRDANNIHRFQPAEAQVLTVYKNGVQCRHDGPFRAYAQAETRAFLQDILDGYFPLELKDQFPEGVEFTLVDKSTEVYRSAVDPGSKFTGPGNRLGSGTTTITARTRRESAASRLLSRLPRSVVHQGKVVEIREGISNMLRSVDKTSMSHLRQTGELMVVATPTLALLQKQAEASARPRTPMDIATLRIKVEDTPMLLKMRFDETIGDVVRLVQEELMRLGRVLARDEHVELHHLRRKYVDTTQTLREAGLIPNATLNARLVH